MDNFNIKIAEEIINITVTYKDTYDLCKDYLCNETGTVKVEISKEDIEYERKKSFDEAVYEDLVPYNYSDGYLESIAVYRKIANALIGKDIIVFHGAVIELNGQGFLFTAKSGTGKTTHINLWQEVYKGQCTIVNGDKPLLKIKEDGVYAYGTPWCGKENLNTNTSVKLKGLCILTRDTTNHIEKLTFKEAIDILLQQTYRPNDSKFLIKTIQLLNWLNNKVDLYKLGCNMDKEAAVVSYNGMKDE